MILPGSQGGKVSAQKVRMAFLREQKVRSDEDRSRKEVLKRKSSEALCCSVLRVNRRLAKISEQKAQRIYLSILGLDQNLG